jgi:hypothetical protein
VKRSVQPRNAVQLSEPLNRHLTQYAIAAGAAGVGLLALAQPADAKIIYTPAHAKIKIGSIVPIDLSHDGLPDFWMGIGTMLLSHSFVWAELEQSRLHLSRTQQNVFLGDGTGWATDLRAGFLVDSREWQTMYVGADLGVFIHSKSNNQSTFLGPWANGGKPLKNRYLGLKFYLGGKVHLGWARLSVWPKSVAATLTGYAYETIPNKPIITGKTKGPDVITLEAGSLGALAARASSLHSVE